MYRKIIIYKGDEHRAKMEKQFSQEDLFAEAYSRAYTLLMEIENEMGAYKDEIKKNKRRLARYQGMGNNMIIFCGGRGQGKTSVMQSFAKFLDGTYKDEPTPQSQKNLDFFQEFGEKKRYEMYEVVDSIDPSAMESDESIIRVLISRLFFKLEEYIKSDACLKDDKNFLQNKKDIVKLFEKCYASINCIKSEKEYHCEQNDLQTLSQRGSSAKLKENLHDLIQKYLAMMSGKDDKCGEEHHRYLVIPIDDADLATKKLFRLCEDIRNYLSIPNVIILMAVDYEQLVYATYQRYLKQYKVMREADALSGHSSFDGECHQMAAKYLEKVFPKIHRIDLPQIDDLLMEGYEDIKFEYRIPDKQGERKLVFGQEDMEGCKNFQEQLLKILYQRTGMIFSRPDQKMSPFMPHTLRELTHWVKILSDMHEIDCDEIYQEYQESEKITEELKEKVFKIKENILTIKQYFMGYWCEKYLDNSQVGVLKGIDRATRQHQMTKVYNMLCDYLHFDHRADATYRVVMREIVEKGIDSDIYFQEAFYIYYTIFLNEWFAVALKDGRQFGQIVEFVGRALDLSDYCGDHAKKYQKDFDIMQFDIDAGALRNVLGKDTESSKVCIESFCAAVQDHKIKESVDLFSGTGSETQLTTEAEFLEFNIFRPFLVQLKKGINWTDRVDENDNTLADGDLEENGKLIRAPYLVTIRNIIANSDMQTQMQGITNSWYEKNYENGKFELPGELIPRIYETLQNELVFPDCKGDSEVIQIFNAANARDRKAINTLFLCNVENFNNYIGLVRESINGLNNDIEAAMGEADQVLSLQDNETILKHLEKIESFYVLIEKKLKKVMLDMDTLGLVTEAFGLSSTQGWQDLSGEYSEICDMLEKLKNVREQIGSKSFGTGEQESTKRKRKNIKTTGESQNKE